jgi:hypothetical protein
VEELVVALIILLFKGIGLLLKGIFDGVVRLVRAVAGVVARAQSGEARPADDDGLTTTAPSRKAARAPKAADRAQAAGLIKALDEMAHEVSAEARRCAGEEGNAELGAALAQIADGVRPLIERVRRGGDAVVNEASREGARLDAVASAITVMTSQRRDPELLLLLGDSDALAEACYRPIVEYARGAGIDLGFERAATVLGDSDLFAALAENPARLAAIVLPPNWPVEVAWWPALIHEVGHCFYRSVSARGRRTFDAELRGFLQLPRAGSPIPSGLSPLLESDLRSALGSWLEEMFADAFGVMMLGPAYIRTMMWSFAGTPQAVITCQPVLPDGCFDEHPPAHLRVVLGCRLLAEMGYPTEARHLEAEWRSQHGGPRQFWLPTRNGRWLGLSEEPLVMRAVVVMTAFYDESFASLGGEPLRSVPGLDFGPREHQAALDVSVALLGRRPPSTRDARVLIAGAVLAWAKQPKQGAAILRGARAHITAVEVSRRRLRLRAEAADAADEAALDAQVGEDVIRDAILLDAILRRPQLRR